MDENPTDLDFMRVVEGHILNIQKEAEIAMRHVRENTKHSAKSWLMMVEVDLKNAIAMLERAERAAKAAADKANAE